MTHFKKLSIFIFILAQLFVMAQEKDKKEDKKEEKSPQEKVKDALKKSQLIDGVLKIYRDSTDGTLRMLLSEKDLNKEFIYFSQLNNGIAQFRLIRGSYKESMVFTMEKRNNNIQLVRQNYSYYFDPESALYRAKDANINHPVLASLKIEAEDEINKQIVIKIDDLFLKETFTQIKPQIENKSSNAFTIGSLSSDKSYINEVKNYPDNFNVKSTLVYSKGESNNNGGDAVLDARNISVEVFHSIIEMPKNNYQARYDDPRIGYFLTMTDNQTSSETVNFRDMIHRWNLVKKNPSLPLSEPVEPITWWIENTTPVEFRELIKEGVLKWNKAFEKAGFKDAMQVKVQPDDATWDAGDIHYNVLRWTSSPDPAFGGYGPSFVNPKTGEILGADIMLEYIHHTNRVFYSKLWDAQAIENLNENEYSYCSAGHFMQLNNQLAKTVVEMDDLPADELNRMEREAMLELVMHEIGHTLGLNHNMKASYLYTPEQLYDPNFAKDKALAGSVMDYVTININPDRANQGAYYSTEVGPYDIWAIQYGYTPNLNETQLQRIAEQSNAPEFIFGNDADDMRYPGKAMDPRVMVNDISNDPLRYSQDRMEFILGSYNKLIGKLEHQGEFYEDFRRGVNTLIANYWGANKVVANWVGGLYINRSSVGQKASQATYTPVTKDQQKKAMQILSQYAFSEKAYDIPSDLFSNYAKQRRGYNFYSGTDDIKIHDIILSHQKEILRQLLHPNTLERIVNTQKYGNTYSLNQMLSDLTAALFEKDIKGNVSTYRQNVQNLYVEMLIDNYRGSILNSVEKNAILSQLLSIEKMSDNKSGDDLSKAHKKYLVMRIKAGIKPSNS